MALSRDLKPWHAYLGAGLALIPVYYALPSGGKGQAALFVFLDLSALLAILSGIRLNRPRLPLPWRLFAFGSSCSVVGAVFLLLQPDAQTPSWSDAAPSQAPVLGAGFWVLGSFPSPESRVPSPESLRRHTIQRTGFRI